MIGYNNPDYSCPYCGYTGWTLKLFESVCLRCRTSVPYRVDKVKRVEVLWPCRGVELIREALK